MGAEMKTLGADGTAAEGNEKAARASPEGYLEPPENATGFAAIILRDIMAGGLLIRAVLAIDQADRLAVLDSIRDQYLHDNAPAFVVDNDAMGWARCWAEIASRAERKAYALACFEALDRRDQEAFLAYVNGRVAA